MNAQMIAEEDLSGPHLTLVRISKMLDVLKLEKEMENKLTICIER